MTINRNTPEKWVWFINRSINKYRRFIELFLSSSTQRWKYKILFLFKIEKPTNEGTNQEVNPNLGGNSDFRNPYAEDN